MKTRKNKSFRKKTTKIRPKSPFKESSSIGQSSYNEMQEWTGDSTSETNGFLDLAHWPIHDNNSDVKPEPLVSNPIEVGTYKPIGKSMPDILHELFIDGQIGILFIIGLGFLFAVILYQDNAAGKWEDISTILLSLRKVGIGALFLLVLFAIVKLLTLKK